MLWFLNFKSSKKARCGSTTFRHDTGLKVGSYLGHTQEVQGQIKTSFKTDTNNKNHKEYKGVLRVNLEHSSVSTILYYFSCQSDRTSDRSNVGKTKRYIPKWKGSTVTRALL